MTMNSCCPPLSTMITRLRVAAVTAGVLATATFAAAADMPVVHIPEPNTPKSGMMTLPGTPAFPALRVSSPVALELQMSDGRWRVDAAQWAHWELRIRTDNATHVGLALQDWMLPNSAEVHATGDAMDQRGPYGNHQRSADGQLWIPALRGTSLTLRVSLPASEMSAFMPGPLSLQYGTLPIDGRGGNVGGAGNCHNHVVCPEGDDWDEGIRATARLLIGNSILCSAVLLNNTAQDGAPLLMTADHCGLGDSDGRFPASSVVALFNFESDRCDANSGFSTSDWLAGASLLYRNTRADISLVRLDNAPPDSYNVVYGGWDASGVTPPSGTGVHHPAGDLKRISLSAGPLQKRLVSINPDNGEDPVLVDTWELTWSSGVTEPGSSGSALWNPQQRVVGVLTGGGSECPTTGPGGQIQQAGSSGPDFYGRMDVAWNSPGALGVPLRQLLDPLDVGVLSIAALGTASDGPEPPADDDDGNSGGGSDPAPPADDDDAAGDDDAAPPLDDDGATDDDDGATGSDPHPGDADDDSGTPDPAPAPAPAPAPEPDEDDAGNDDNGDANDGAVEEDTPSSPNGSPESTLGGSSGGSTGSGFLLTLLGTLLMRRWRQPAR